MRHVAAIVGILVPVSALVLACGSTTPAHDSSPDASSVSPDAAPRDGSPDDASSYDAGTDVVDTPPTYPNCIKYGDAGASQAWLACDSNQTCVYPCTGCPGAVNECLILAGGGSTVAGCQASCSDCKLGSVSRTDACDGQCTDLQTDNLNCGTCGHSCASGSTCGQGGHCCPQTSAVGPTTWNESCGLCCAGTAACTDGGGNVNNNCVAGQ